MYTWRRAHQFGQAKARNPSEMPTPTDVQRSAWLIALWPTTRVIPPPVLSTYHQILPLQDVVSLQSFIVGVNHPCIAPTHLQSLPYFNTIARALRNIRPPTDPPFVCHTPYIVW